MMPWHLFGRATRHELTELQRDLRHAERDRDLYKRLHDEETFRHDRYRLEANRVCTELRDQIVRLRRGLDSMRNHVPLYGVVFNGEVL